MFSNEKFIDLLRATFILDWDWIHGASHWARVRDNGRKLAAETGANVRVVDYFAFLHDVCRQHDGHDPEHGPRAAQFVRAIRAEHIDLDDAEFNLLIEAIEGHTSGSMHDDVTVATCWDADRLDIGRVWQHVTPAPSYLSTTAAKRPEMIAHALARSRLWRQRYSIRQLTRGAGDTPIHLTHKDVVPIVNCEHPRQRMTLLLGVRKFMTDADWLRALSDVWGGCDDITANREALSRALPKRVCSEMMTEVEQQILAELPEVVEVFRGVTSGNTSGLCWSLDRRWAAMIVNMLRYRGDAPRLLTARVPRDKIIALRLDAGEQEIITFDAEVINVDPITSSPFSEASYMGQGLTLRQQEVRAGRNRAAIDALLQGRILPLAEVDQRMANLRATMRVSAEPGKPTGLLSHSLADVMMMQTAQG